MKPLYVIILFFIVFQMAALIIGALDVFPYGLYSDFDASELAAHDTPQGMLTYLFVPEGNNYGLILGDFTIPVLIAAFLGAGTLFSYVTQSFAPVSIVIVGTVLTPMLTKSISFFNQIFSKGDSVALTYLGLLLGICVLVIVVFTIIEMPTHGRS